MILDSAMSELRYFASRTFLNNFLVAKIILGFINVLPFGCSSLYTEKMISYCSSMSSSLLTLSCKWIGTLHAR